MLSSTEPYGLPHEPGLRSWSSGSSTASTPSSVEPYTSNRKPSPSLAMISCFSAYGTGAALATSERIEDRSARASTSSGSATMRFSCVGAVNVLVTPVLAHEVDPPLGVEVAHAARSSRRGCG